MSQNKITRQAQGIVAFVLLLFLAALAMSCGGGGGTSTASSDGTSTGVSSSGSGDLVVSLTDADGDCVGYTVDVKSINLTKAGGDVVSILPNSTRVDFAQLTDMTEFLSIATVPSGVYTAASMVVDFSNADVQVEVSGAAMRATVKDSDGNVLNGETTLRVTLSNAKKLTIAPGVAAHLSLDFDLESSNTVDPSVSPPVVTVSPVLVAEISPSKPKDTRVRGLLGTVNTAASSFQLGIRPFSHKEGAFGNCTVNVSSGTEYEIDGQSYLGASGLEKLAAMPNTTFVAAWGDIQLSSKSLLASKVHAGTSVPGGDKDVVAGSVIAKNGSLLTVRGATIIRKSGSFVFNDDVTVDLSGLSSVRRLLDPTGSYTTDDIRVGSWVTAFGTLSGTAALGSVAHLRIGESVLAGIAASTSGGALTMNIQFINGRLASVFGLSGASSYVVSTGGISLTSVDANDFVKVRGFFTASGFTAVSVIDLSDGYASEHISWTGKGSSSPFASASASGFTINLQSPEIGLAHHVLRGGMTRSLLNFGTTNTIVPASGGNGVFTIKAGGQVYMYSTMASYAEALAEKLLAGAKVKYLVARGGFDGATGKFTAAAIGIQM